MTLKWGGQSCPQPAFSRPSKWDQRIARADELSAQYPFAAEGLRFYIHLARFQKDFYDGMPAGDDLQRLLPKFPAFLAHIAAAAPAPLAQSAQDLQNRGPSNWFDLLAAFWRDAAQFQPGSGRAPQMLAWMFLQPYAEYQADHSGPPPPRDTYSACPVCHSRPVAGALRQEGDGGKRSLVCSLCATEWNIGRLVCAACGEEDVTKLAVYTAEQLPYMRVEACDTCRYYIKTVDLTKNGRAVPVVDELAGIPLDLWAHQHQYTKLHANLLGL